MASTESSDTHFFNNFSLVLGILIFIAIVLFAVARAIGAAVQVEPRRNRPDPDEGSRRTHRAGGARSGRRTGQCRSRRARRRRRVRRRRPTCRRAAKPPTRPCAPRCHATGINGAPKIGDHAAWGPRIAQGKDALYQHALAGKGNMPARGGTDLARRDGSTGSRLHGVAQQIARPKSRRAPGGGRSRRAQLYRFGEVDRGDVAARRRDRRRCARA